MRRAGKIVCSILPAVLSVDLARGGVLTLEVNTASGRTIIINQTGGPVEFDFYELFSPAASLNPDGWLSLETQGIDDNGAPGDGIGWEILGIPSATLLAEGFLFGATTLADGTRLSLGFAFNPDATEQLLFTYQSPGSEMNFTGQVVFDPTVLGDMDGSGVLDAFDVAPFEMALADPALYLAAYPGLDPVARGDLNGDGALDAFDVSAFESTLAGGTLGAAAEVGMMMVVPEPAAGGLLGLVGWLGMRRRR